MTVAGTKSLSIDTSEIEKMAAVFSASEPMVHDEMRSGMRRAGDHALHASKRHITNRTGNLAGSGRVEVTLTGRTIEARIRFLAKYARWVNDGRGPVVAKGKALHFFIDGKEIFVKSVGPAAGVHYLEKGRDEALPQMTAEMEATAKRIASRIEQAV